MVAQVPSVLVALVTLIDVIPAPDPPAKRRRGRSRTYSDRLFLKALVIMLVRRLSKVHLLLAVLAEPTPELAALRALLTEGGCYPTRRTWERRLAALPATLPAQIGCLGRGLVGLVQPWRGDGPAAAIDSTVLVASGGVWHKKHRNAGVVPHTAIDTDAHWTKSGWHGWVYGWKLHLVVTVTSVWISLAALTSANIADNEEVLRLLITTRGGAYPHHDPGVDVRHVFHQLRSHAIENLNEQFNAIFDVHGSVPTKGCVATRRWVLGAVFVYQLLLLRRFDQGQGLRVGPKACLRAV